MSSYKYNRMMKWENIDVLWLRKTDMNCDHFKIKCLVLNQSISIEKQAYEMKILTSRNEDAIKRLLSSRWRSSLRQNLRFSRQSSAKTHVLYCNYDLNPKQVHHLQMTQSFSKLLLNEVDTTEASRRRGWNVVMKNGMLRWRMEAKQREH